MLNPLEGLLEVYGDMVKVYKANKDPSVPNCPQNGGVKCATGASSKIRGRDNITIGTWNTRTLTAAGKLQELTHEMDRYRWNILGLCEMRWKNFGETTTEEGHKVFFSGKEDKHEHGVGFLVHKDIVNTDGMSPDDNIQPYRIGRRSGQ